MNSNLPVLSTRICSYAQVLFSNDHVSTFCSAASDIDRAMLNVLEENARLLNQIEANILTSQVGILYVW